jgi:hypothetical protein
MAIRDNYSNAFGVPLAVFMTLSARNEKLEMNCFCFISDRVAAMKLATALCSSLVVLCSLIAASWAVQNEDQG